MVDKYTLKVPQDLADVFQNYLDEHPELGYTFVSEFMRDILRDKSQELKQDLKKEKKSKIIKLESGEYTIQDLMRLIEEKKD
jgi:hypothetical protein